MLHIPLGVWAQTTREVNQPQFGKQVITVASDEVITFKDPKGDTDYTGQTSENAQSLTVFQPKEAGMSVQITFESMNKGGSNSYYSFANVYSGDPDADNTFSWATKTEEVSSSYSASLLPSGEILRAYPNEKGTTYTNETYTSAAADGSLTKQLSEVFNLDASNGTITYALADEVDSNVKAEVSIDTDGNLVITGTEAESFRVVVKATQGGHTEYISLPVTVTVPDDITRLMANPDVDGFYDLNGRRLQRPQPGVNILRMKNGTTMKVTLK